MIEIVGMEGVDKEKVQRIVYEMSKGSKYFENEEKKEAYMKQKIENMRIQYSKLTAQDISHHQKVFYLNDSSFMSEPNCPILSVFFEYMN